MKKLMLIMAGLIMMSVLNAQTLEEIVKKYTEANKLDQVSQHSTVLITASLSVMGMDLPMTMWLKNPNKIKTVTSFNGQDIVSVVNGDKGYSINPMTGSTDPVEMTPDQLKQTLRSSVFENYMANYLKNGQLTLEGEENVNDKPAFKLKATLDDATIDIFIDKSTYYLVKSSATTQGTIVESYPSDYTDNGGIIVPMKTTTSAQGMDMQINFTKVEVDVPIADSVFMVKP